VFSHLAKLSLGDEVSHTVQFCCDLLGKQLCTSERASVGISGTKLECIERKGDFYCNSLSALTVPVCIPVPAHIKNLHFHK